MPADVQNTGPSVDLDAARRARVSNSRGRQRARALAPAAVGPAITKLTHGAPFAFVARESPEYDHMLLERMIFQVLEPHRGIAAVDRALELGVKPLLDTADGRKLRAELGARLLYFSNRPKKYFGVQFEIDGVPFLYGLLSGAKASTLQGDNDWVDAVTDLVNEYTPAKLCTGPMSRLARLKRLFATLQYPLSQSRTVVYTYEVPHGINVNDPGGQAQWDALASAAEWDYKAILSRLLTGVVYVLKHGGFPRTDVNLMPGYAKPYTDDARKHHVEVVDDPDARELVRAFIELAASDLTPLEVGKQLGELGVVTRNPALRKKYGNLLAHEVGDPGKLATTLFQHLPTYLDGKYLFRIEIRLENLDEFHGLTVHRTHKADNGYLERELDFGLPEGGWHDADLIRAAINKRLITGRRPAVSRATLKRLFRIEGVAVGASVTG